MRKRKLALAAAVLAGSLLAVVPVAGATATTVSVGGGLWQYGTTGTQVYSYYHHSTKYHSATACNQDIFQPCVQVTAVAGSWAKVTLTKRFTGGNTAYWNTY